ncbi:unnamed protein product, partial [Durusdinium trenchii]
ASARSHFILWGHYLCGSVPGGCSMDASQSFVQKWTGRPLGTPDDEAEALRAALSEHPHPRASRPDFLLCTNLAVFCWLLRRRGMRNKLQDVGPALHVRGSRASKQNYWFTKGACKCIIYTCVGPQNSTCPTELRRKQSSSSQSQKIQSAGSKRRLLRDVRETSAFPSCLEMLEDFHLWWQSVDKDIFAASQELLSVQMWWQMGVRIPFVPLAGTYHTGATYDPPQKPTLLVLRSAFWHLPAGRVFASLMERFASTGVHLAWLGRYDFSVPEHGPQEPKWRSLDEMARHTCALDVPAELSQLKVRDVMSIGLPLMSPERAWILRLLHDMYRGWGQLHVEYSSERTPRIEKDDWPHAPFYDPKVDPISRLSYWLPLADHFRYPHVLHFASLPEMLHMVHHTNWADVSVKLRAHNRKVIINSEQFYRRSLLELIVT